MQTRPAAYMGSDESEEVVRTIEMNIGGRPLAMQMRMSGEPVKPHRALPVFQQMTNAFVDLSVKMAEDQGGTISCKAGCGACCRQVVPIGEIEVYHIAELVESMPEPRRSEVKKRFSDACEHFAKIGWFDTLAACGEQFKSESFETAAKEWQEAVNAYFREGISCPFLENESCSIHPARPLVCREYLVTSPAENCSGLDRSAIQRIGLVVSPSKTVQYVGRTGRISGPGFLPLIRALQLAEEYPEAYEETKAEDLIDEFFSRLSNSPEPKEKSVQPLDK